MSAVAARARGRLATVIAKDAIDGARDPRALATLLGVDRASTDDVERIVRARAAADHAILARWTDALATVVLDDDRRSVRAIVRGMVASVPVERRLAGTTPTPSLPARVLDQLAHASTPHELARALGTHPYGTVFVDLAPPIDLIEVEAALARRFAELASRGDRALATYVAQVIDAENAGAALLLAARGHELAAAASFVEGGRVLDRATFLAAAASPYEDACDRIARAFARTPLGAAIYAIGPAALEDAALAWQLATQAQLRRTEPLGLAPALHLVLHRRDEARRLRRAAWRIALGGVA